jgi:DNA-binding response OmpR family regulator
VEKKKNILIIDDDKSILRFFALILQKQEFETDTAETGEEAMEKISNRSYDLALIDVKLPDIDGIDLVGRINSTNPNLIKIVITGFASVEDGVKALDSGADAYLVKPVKPEELLRIVKDKLKR